MDIKTELLGYSQTYQWYTGQPLNLSDNSIINLIRFAFDPTVGNKMAKKILNSFPLKDNWQARFRFGGDLSGWKDINYDGWQSSASHGVRFNTDEIDRLIFNISGKTRKIDKWINDIQVVVEIILSKYPNLSELYLQPVIGCNQDNNKIRASKNHADILFAINKYIENSNNNKLKLGAVFKVNHDEFSDKVGHLTATGANKAKKYIMDFYDNL